MEILERKYTVIERSKCIYEKKTTSSNLSKMLKDINSNVQDKQFCVYKLMYFSELLIIFDILIIVLRFTYGVDRNICIYFLLLKSMQDQFL